MPLLAIHEAQLIRDASVSRIELSSLLQPLLSGGQITLFEVSKPKIVSGVGKGRLDDRLVQIPNSLFKRAVFQVQPAQVIQDVGMLSHFTLHDFKLPARFM